MLERRRAHRRRRGPLPATTPGSREERITAPPVGTSRDGMSTLHLEPVVESTPVARHWVAAHLRDLPAEVTGCAALLTSELVTNAVLHAATPMCVTLHILPDRIRVDVADGNPAFPSIKEYGTDAATGRGLTLFNTLAVELGRPGRRRRQDRVVRAPGRLPGRADERLRRQLPLRPDRHRATRTSTTTAGDVAASVRSGCSGSPSACCRSRARSTRPCSASSVS